MDEQSVIRERLKLLSEYTNDLSELQAVDLPTYVENKLVRRSVERTLHLAVEACLDIGQHIHVVFSILKSRLGDLYSYARAIANYLEATYRS